MRPIFSALGIALLSAAFVLNSCNNNNDDNPAPASTGTISGKFSPATAITRVTATDTALATFTATPGADGTFGIDNLKPGRYNVTFTPASGFVAPAARSVQVAAGTTRDQGTLTVAPASATGGTVTYVVDGRTVTATLVTGTALSGAFSLGASGGLDALVITISTIAGTGTYPIEPGSGAALGVYSNNGNSWATPGVGTGAVQVTTFNTTTRKAVGTFAFTAGPSNAGAMGTKNITSGVFDVSF